MFLEIGEDVVKKTFTQNTYQSLRHHEDIYQEQKNVCYTDEFPKAQEDLLGGKPNVGALISRFDIND